MAVGSAKDGSKAGGRTLFPRALAVFAWAALAALVGFLWGRASTSPKGDLPRVAPSASPTRSSSGLMALDEINRTLPPGFRAKVYVDGINYPVTVADDPEAMSTSAPS